MTDEVTRYYAARADVYDETAGYFDRDAEALREPLKDRYRELFKGKNVLEVACGSGYWTRVLGEVAASVFAFDINQEILPKAVERCRDLPNVTFRIADAYTFLGVPTGFDAAVAVWWYSHVPKANLSQFLRALRGVLAPGALVMFNDQLPYEPAVRTTDRHGDTREERTLPDGRRFSVIKNFPSEAELRAAVSPFASEFAYAACPGEGRWEVVWRVKG
jgi:protein-L-isoaspartate O-methyltransferase